MNKDKSKASHWTFLTNHSHVLICLNNNPEMLMRDIASEVKITERAVQRIIAELTSEGYINHSKCGRRNSYTINKGKNLRHPVENDVTIFELLNLIKNQKDIYDE